MMRAPMELAVLDEPRLTVMTIAGPVTANYSPQLREAIGDAFDQGKSVIVDLAQCDYMDSSGLATLVEAVQLAEQNQQNFCLSGPFDEKVRHLFEITRLDVLFDQYHCASIDDARKRLTT